MSVSKGPRFKHRQQLVGRYLVFSVPMHFIFTYYTSNEMEYISLSNGMNNLIIKLSLEKW